MHTYQEKEKSSSAASPEVAQPGKRNRVTPDMPRIPAWPYTLPYPPLLAPDQSAVVQNNSSAQENIPSFSDKASHFWHDFSRIPVSSSHPSVLQTKLQVNQPGDVYEREADQVAEQVMRMTDSKSSVSNNEGEAKNFLTRKQGKEPGAEAATGFPDVSPIVHTVLSSDGGQPLDTATRALMEPRFGHEFSQVRVHTDAQAAQSSRALNALAYTVGRDVVFGTGQYQPRTSDGQRLMAHELTHVVQQTGGSQHTFSGIARSGQNISASGLTIHRAIQTMGGDWDTDTYDIVKDAGASVGVDIDLKFIPKDPVDATLIGMTQTANSIENGSVLALSATARAHSIPKGETGVEEGAHIDHLKESALPLYASQLMSGVGHTLANTPTNPGWGNHGHHYKGDPKPLDAHLKDTPTLPGSGNNSSQTFESTAVAIEGSQTGTYYGSVRWGWTRDGAGKFTKLPLSLVSVGIPSPTFRRATELWNAGKTSGGADTVGLPTTTLSSSTVHPSSLKTSELAVKIAVVNVELSTLPPGTNRTNKDFEKQALETELSKRPDKPTTTLAIQERIATGLSNKDLEARSNKLISELTSLSRGAPKTDKELELFALQEEALKRFLVSAIDAIVKYFKGLFSSTPASPPAKTP